MDNQEELRRLSKLFADLKRLAVNPAGHTPESLPDPKTTTEDQVGLSLQPEINADAVVSPHPISEPEADEQHSEEPLLYEQAKVEYAHDEDTVEDLDDSNSSLPGFSDSISSPFTTGEPVSSEMSTDPESDESLQPDELDLTNWQVVGIGTACGILVAALVIGITYQMELFDNLGRLVVVGTEILFCILGAFFGRLSKETRLAVWIEAIKWSLIPIVIRICRFFCCSFL